jgi:hypothetical protein
MSVLFLETLSVVLSQNTSRSWYSSTKNLQLSSRDVCRACRETPTLVVSVTRNTPRRIWSSNPGDSRLPSPIFYGLEWALPLEALRFESRINLERVIFLRLSPPIFDIRLSCLSLFRNLKHLKLEKFDEPVDRVTWPTYLVEIFFGNSFNQAIEKVTWPTSLERLSFGNVFDQGVVGVCWPRSLKHVKFGKSFNHPVVGVAWPPFLEGIEFGTSFDKELDGVVWPPNFQNLSLGFDVGLICWVKTRVRLLT